MTAVRENPDVKEIVKQRLRFVGAYTSYDDAYAAAEAAVPSVIENYLTLSGGVTYLVFHDPDRLLAVTPDS